MILRKIGAHVVLVTAIAVLAGCGGSTPKASRGAPLVAEAPVEAPRERPVINPDADQLLKSTSEALASTKQFSFKAEVWSDEVIGAGHKVCTTKTIEVQVARPNRLHAEIRSPKRSRGIWYDSKTLTTLDRAKNLYGTVEATGTIDKMLDAANEKYGIVIPLDDLILADPYASAMPGIRGAAYFGKATILGVPCKHIAFSTDVVDWQLWVEDGGQHMPRKIVITYKLEDSAPQYTAIFSDWVLNQPILDSAFVFTAPQGAAKINVLPRKADAE